MKLPEWAAREEIYNPGSDRDYFISRSLLRLVSIPVSYTHLTLPTICSV